MFYKEIFKPRLSDYDRNRKLSYEAILNILETVGNHQLRESNAKTIEDTGNGTAFIIASWKVKMLHRPSSTDDVHVTTWVRGKAPTSVLYREYIVTDEKGKELIYAQSRAAMIDTATGRPVRVNEEMFQMYQPEEKVLFEDNKKVRPPKEYTLEKELTLRYSDIDFNNHVHNTRYIDLALEIVPKEILEEDSISEFQVVYVKSLMEQDRTTLKYVETEEGKIVGIFGNDQLCCLVQIITA